MKELLPALIVVLSIDQFRYDYLQRFAPLFGSGGFARLEREGAVFTNARQRHSVTSTAPGHAAIGGGTVPAENGIVANRWLERDAPYDEARWQAYYAEIAPYRAPDVGRASARRAGLKPPLRFGSPAFASDVTALRAKSLSDHLPEKKIISLALTDRAAILMGGRGADAVYWFDGPTARFVARNGSADVLAFNDLVPGYMPASRQWNLLHEEARRVVFDPPEAWPLKNTAYGGTFPHSIPTLRALQYTPFAHELVLDFAQHVIAIERPDLLFVGISSTDYLGHLYGPDSLEVADSAIRLDRALEHFLAALERRYGKGVLVVVTSDHGVQSIPEVARLRDRRADTGRVDLRVPDAGARTIRELSRERIAIERGVAHRLGLPFSLDTPLDEAFVSFFEEPMLYLNPRHANARTRRALRDTVRELDGVANAWTRDETLPPLFRNSFHSERSGDVMIELRPGWIWMWGSNSTTHGQPVDADLHVPLIFWGAGVQAGTHAIDASPLDIAPTLGALFNVEAGGRASQRLPVFGMIDSDERPTQ